MSLDPTEINSSYERSYLSKSSIISEIPRTNLSRLSRKTGYCINELIKMLNSGLTKEEIYGKIQKRVKEETIFFFQPDSIKGLSAYFNKIQI